MFSKPGGKIVTSLSFTERYLELHELGYQDWQIAKRLGMSLSSLERGLQRCGMPVSPLLAEMANEERSR